MNKSIYLLPILCACSHAGNVPEPVFMTGHHGVILPHEFRIVECSREGYFIRLSSPNKVSSEVMKDVANSLSSKYDRIDFCTELAHERGDEYASIIGSQIYDYDNDKIYQLATE